MEEGKVTSAAEIKRDALELVTTKATGRTYGIRRVWPREMAMSGLLSPELENSLNQIADAQQVGTELDEFQTATLIVYINSICCLGVSSMKVVDKPQDQCKGDEVAVESLGVDRAELAEAILAKAGWAKASDGQGSVVALSRDGESKSTEDGPDSIDRAAVDGVGAV